jgi:hypothetical protein
LGYCWTIKIWNDIKDLLQKYWHIIKLDAKAALLCLSLASRKSFENLDKWIKELT